MMSQHEISDQGYFKPVTRQGELPFWSVALCLAYVCLARSYVHV
jgi:hypothetical protein